MFRNHMLYALVAALLCAFSFSPVSLAEPASQTAGPGLGDSFASPVGTPIDLRLPPGYSLRSIVGGEEYDIGDLSSNFLGCFDFDHGSPPPPCLYRRGYFEVTLQLAVAPSAGAGVTSNRGACVDQPAWGGWLLTSADDEAQNILVPIDLCTTAQGTTTPVLEVERPSGSSLNLVLAGYCMNLSRHIPDTEHPFDVGVRTSDGVLGQILGAIDGKNLYERESQSTIQDIIWDYVDFVRLPGERIAELQALP